MINNTRDYRNGDPNVILDPNYVTGITDGEGTFSISTSNDKIAFQYKVSQKRKNRGILHDIVNFFGGHGSVIIDSRRNDQLKYQVRSVAVIIEVIIPHFDTYPLLTSKSLNYQDFKRAIAIAASKDLSHREKLAKIKRIKAKMNKRRSFRDKYESVTLNTSLNPMWVLGFVDGEGCFYVYANDNVKSRNSTYTMVTLSIEVSQSSHDVLLLHSFVRFFGRGYVSPSRDPNNVQEIQELDKIRRKSIFKMNTAIPNIIKFFDEHLLLTDKREDFLKFKEIWELKCANAHKTFEGFQQIKALKDSINRKRK